MTWFPWTKSPAYSAMPQAEFIEWLRYRAIDFGMPPAFIDCIDGLQRLEGAQAEIDQLKAELEEANDNVGDLKDRLSDLRKEAYKLRPDIATIKEILRKEILSQK